MAKEYTAKDITVLEGLEPVRKRPGMYIGSVDSAGLHHLLWEIVDNSVDEAMNEHCDRIDVTLHKDGETITVRDNGRGIPVDVHSKYRKPALELILTTLHAGGKFESKNYYHSGGLHGVGASVVTALSDRLVARVKRDGAEWEQSYARGVATGKLRKVGPARGSGTTIEFHPDPKIFTTTRFDAKLIEERLEAKAYLHRGLTVVFDDKRAGQSHTFHYEDGIRAYLEKLLSAGSAKRVPAEIFYAARNADGAQMECALAWTEDTSERISSFVNSIPTSAGGTHENGLKSGLVKAVRSYLEIHNLVPRGLQIAAEDVREGVVGLLSCFVPNPQFQGQTKERLNNPELTAVVDGFVRSALENWLNANRSSAESIAARVVLAARARSASRAAAKEVQRKTAVSHRLNLPGKLADCASTNPAESELFLVEGDSAGGSAKQGRDRHFQAILPLRGKVLNTEQASAAKVLSNQELSDIVKALGCGMGKDFDASKLRYHRICLLMDADSDGNHIATLLMTFFYRHLPELIRGGYLYLAVPPLYRIDIGKETHWARDDDEKDAILARPNGRATPQVQRFKGLGEMNPATLKETTLDPRRRTLLKVTIADAAKTEATIQTLMGRDVAPRFQLIMERAIGVSDIDV
ncbi:MAG TPA: DNA topoisomerase IV subunit B [Candidatus Binatia bacterium]|nr:DNA topoisomerase IV subunit B [Candidatus Binatia bacterium]